MARIVEMVPGTDVPRVGRPSDPTNQGVVGVRYWHVEEIRE